VVGNLLESGKDYDVCFDSVQTRRNSGCFARVGTRRKWLSRLNKTFIQPTTAQRCRSETEKNILDDFLSSVLSQLKKYHPSGNLTFNNLGIFQSLTFRILMKKKILPISLKVNFTPNILSCCGFTHSLSKPELFWRQLDLLKPLNSTLLIDAKNNKT